MTDENGLVAFYADKWGRPSRRIGDERETVAALANSLTQIVVVADDDDSWSYTSKEGVLASGWVDSSASDNEDGEDVAVQVAGIFAEARRAQ